MNQNKTLQATIPPSTNNNNNNNSKRYIEVAIPSDAKFTLNADDWQKLKSLQKGHRFLRGEWEDYFVMGMKESNKYCVFAFKDHYVNKSCMRARRNKKYFSANGYCVFEDCQVKFTLKMSEEREVCVKYTGKMCHCVTEVHARYFRGKSRQELKEILKYTTPMREYLNRMQNADSEQIEVGNCDFIGRSTAVYRRIAAEAKDVYQSLLLLRSQFIEKTQDCYLTGYIQLIQYIPGCIICFNENQIKYMFNQSSTHALYLSSTDTLVSTTIDGKLLYYYELCLGNPEDNEKSLIPISSMLCGIQSNVYSNELLISNWFKMLIDTQKSMFNGCSNTSKYIICDNSLPMIKSMLLMINGKSLQEYIDWCFMRCTKKTLKFELNRENDDDDELDLMLLNEIKSKFESDLCIIHVCNKQILNDIEKMCSNYYSEDNLKFGIYAFNCLVQCDCVDELKLIIYSLFTVLYSKYINTHVENSFDYLKSKASSMQAINKTNGLDTASASLNDNFNCQSMFSIFNSFDSVVNANQPSKFQLLIESIYRKVKFECDSSEDDVNLNRNPRYCPILIECFIQKLSSTIPLWSKLMLNHVNDEQIHTPLTLKQHLERFSLLKSLLAHEKDSLDVFIKRLYDENNDLLKAYLNDFYIKQDVIRYIEMQPFEQNGILPYSNTKSSSTDLLRVQQAQQTSSTNGTKRVKVASTRGNNSLKRCKLREDNEQETDDDDDDDDDDDEDDSENDESTDEIVIERNNEIVSNRFDIYLIKDDLETLECGNAISTSVIEFYLKLLELKSTKDEQQHSTRLYTFSIDFYACLKYGYNEKNSKFFVNNSLFDYDLLFIPIKKSELINLAIIDFKKQKIIYYDTQLNNDYDCIKYLMEFLDREYCAHMQKKFDFSNWKISNEKNIPKHVNSKDCGLFMLFYAKCLLYNQEVNNYAANDIQAFRLQLKEDILENIYLQD